MDRKKECVRVFVAMSIAAYALYALTLPEGLPWGVAKSLASAWMIAAFAAGLLGSLVTRYLGWRAGAAVALIWSFMPGVWNRAIVNDRSIAFVAFGIVGLWTLNAIMLLVLRKAIATRSSASKQGRGDLSDARVNSKRGWRNGLAGWIFLGVAVLFALVSLVMHDYQVGEVASIYARQIVAEAGERIILLNGVCDAQIAREAEGAGLRCVSFRNDEAERTNLVAWVKREWPGETNLWVAAQVGADVFADAAIKVHPERFYTMKGQSTTLEKWAARWEAMKPYLDSRDRFVPAMRHLFAYEGNVLGNAAQEKGEMKQAWTTYWQVFAEIEPKNPAACVNLNEMLRRGYKVDERTRQRVESAQTDFAKLLKDKRKAEWVAKRIAASGPVMRDQKAYEEWRERIRKRMVELEKAGEKPKMSEKEFKTLLEWKDEMMAAFMEHDMDKAVRIARTILARPRWRRFIPANMVLGEQMLRQGDLVAAESFLRIPAEATGDVAPPAFVLNDYAETLRRLGHLDEAEKYARQSVEKAGANAWIAQFTLAEVLSAKAKGLGEGEARRFEDIQKEVRELVAAVIRQAPTKVKERLREKQKKGEVLK